MLLPQKLALALSSLSALTLVAAQKSNFTINPDAVPIGTRSSWCLAEINTCGTLCAGNPASNDCDTTDLTFHCTCQNNSSPGLQYYTGTMPTFVCQQAFQDCIAQNVGDKSGQDKCTSDIQKQCGTLDPNKAETGNSAPSSSSSSSSHSASATSAGTATETGGASAPSSTATNAAPKIAALVGNSVAGVAAGLFVAFL
ncbi:hypothetical protein QBC33DRAFT_512921 [Phialemonium atrogriseum]|uniref:DUF7707 domain-containing protein n=1 Tax=Phialemonium atrogriseum TaxID=1093897 RepID=A0AAJ0C627_9PEZI|nr:uncharacterized protein QBC33DRAFT_512921 [Phialemonium atrogriseum]KAK1769402.1 hypothetical protein QBC33DRAFT_512921 [Phialemonium atrogriseum]